MSEHFRAFSFVDQIEVDQVGEKIAGRYHVPAEIEEFPLSLVAESIGQLAAWSSMKAVDFGFRPVAGIAGAVDFFGEVNPGDVLELEANLTKADEEAVGYGGVARVNGQVVVELHECLGPMVPLEDFDDPASLRDRYELLTGEGAEPGAFGGIPFLTYEKAVIEIGEKAEAVFQIPEEAPFFKDHFPRNPVFPGTLLMNVNLRFAVEVASQIEGFESSKPTRMSDVKLRAFMPPGDQLDFSASVIEQSPGEVVVRVQTKKGKKRTSSAKITLAK